MSIQDNRYIGGKYDWMDHLVDKIEIVVLNFIIT